MDWYSLIRLLFRMRCRATAAAPVMGPLTSDALMRDRKGMRYNMGSTALQSASSEPVCCCEQACSVDRQERQPSVWEHASNPAHVVPHGRLRVEQSHITSQKEGGAIKLA